MTAPTPGAVLDARWDPVLAEIEAAFAEGLTAEDILSHFSDRLARPTPEDRAQINASDDNAAYAWELLATPPAQPAPGAGELIDNLMGPHEWGYRDPVEGGFVADDAPFRGGDALTQAQAKIARLEGEVAERDAELDAVSAAIGTVRFMDPPDGGSPTLAEQVRRMHDALKDAEADAARVREENTALRGVVKGYAEAGFRKAQDALAQIGAEK